MPLVRVTRPLFRVTLLIVAVVAALLVPAPAGADATFSWSRPQRLSPGSPDLNHPADMQTRTFPVVFDACASTNAQYYDWTVGLEASPGTVVATHRSNTDCRWEWESPIEANYTVRLQTTPSAQTERAVAVFDLFVAVLGDSFTSGEGAPDSSAIGLDLPEWRDTQCHRSAESWAYQTAEVLERESDRHAVSLSFLACSGAKIDRNPGEGRGAGGLLSYYEGIEFPDDSPTDARGVPAHFLDPQVEQLADLVAAAGRAPDVVLMSGGGNDMEFSSIIKECVLTGLCRVPEGYEEYIDNIHNRVIQRFDQVHLELLTLGVRPADVFVLEYPDLTRPRPSKYSWACYQIPGYEWDYIGDVIAHRLNDRIHRAASRNGYTFLDGIAEAFDGHGSCAGSHRWVVSIRESLNLQLGVNGAFHPNYAGYDAMRDVVLDHVRPHVAQITAA